ncbi:hypothetical protein D3C83_199610 [compost metagenome]
MCDPNIVDGIQSVAHYCDEEFRELRDAAGVPVSDLPDIGVVARANGNGHARPNGATDTAPTAVEPARA